MATAERLTRITGLAALILAGGASAGASAQQAASPALVFDGVTVVDVEQGRLIPGQRVVITGNRIQAMGDAGTVKTPNGAQVVDAQGKYLIPGLWDMHAHPDPASRFGLFHSLLIANGVTGARIPYLAMASVEEQLQWRKEVMAGTQVGPRQLLAGKTLNSFADESWGESPEAVEHGMDSLKAMGLDFFKIYPLSSSTFYLAAAARRVGVPFGGHVDGISAVEASDSGISIIDHLNSAGDLDEQCFPSSGGSLARCRVVAEAFERNGTAFAPTLTVIANYSIGNYLNASLPLFERLTEVARQFWADSLPSHDNWLRTSPNAALRASGSGIIRDTTGVLSIAQQVGLPILAGTDIGPGNVRTMPAGFSLHAELAMMVAEGLTPLTALQSATLNPAKILHATDSLGTVAPGKLADLVLLDANPLEDITNTTTMRAVVANGRYFDRAALDRLLTSVQATAKADDEDP